MVQPVPRGLRNNNPLNIRISSQPWRGKLTPSRDPEFECFVSLLSGIRAAFICLRTYITRHGLNTLSLIVSRWAPSSENNTRAYIRFVTSATSIFADEPLCWYDRSSMIALLYAMARFECGEAIQPYRDTFSYAYDLIQPRIG